MSLLVSYQEIYFKICITGEQMNEQMNGRTDEVAPRGTLSSEKHYRVLFWTNIFLFPIVPPARQTRPEAHSFLGERKKLAIMVISLGKVIHMCRNWQLGEVWCSKS